jgi:hypothetical protein
MTRLAAHVAVFAALLLGGSIAYGEVFGDVREGPPKKAPERRSGSLISVRGHTGGLYPGTGKRIKLQVSNRYRHALELRSIRTRVASAGDGCSGGNVDVAPYRGHLEIPARSRRSVTVPISMVRDAENGCQGARFPLHFEATAGRP